MGHPGEREETGGWSEEMDATSVAGLLEEYRPRLRRIVSLRLDPRLRGRLDSSDVLQESFVEVTRRLPEYRRTQPMPFFVWVRKITGQKLIDLHRRHLGAAKRDARREVPLGFPEATSARLASQLLDPGMSPSRATARAEDERRLHAVFDGLASADQEVLVLRHVEELSNDEAAAVLELTKSGASARYCRALRRLRDGLAELEPRASSEGEARP